MPVFGWLHDSLTGGEQEANHTLQVGVMKGAELFPENLTFVIESVFI